MNDTETQQKESRPLDEPKEAPKGRRISSDGWETNPKWPPGLMRYVSSGTYFGRVKKHPYPAVRRTLETDNYKTACKRLPVMRATLKDELDKRASRNGKQIQPTRWDEAATSFLAQFHGQAIRGEKTFKSYGQLDNVIRRTIFFWPSLEARYAKDITIPEAESFFTEASGGTGRFQKPPDEVCSSKKGNFKKGRQAKASYNKMVCYLKMIASHASEMDIAKGLPGFANPFDGITNDFSMDPPPNLLSRRDFASVAESIRYPDGGDGEEDFLNFACTRFMASQGPRIGELLGRMTSHHPMDKPHPGFRWNDILDSNSTANPEFRIFCLKKRRTKKFKVRMVPFMPGMAEFVKELRAKLYTGDPTALVFAGVNLRTGVNSNLKKACKLLKLPHAHQQDLRHFFVTACVEAGIDYKTIAEWVGHSDGGILIAKIYGHLRPEHSHEMAARVSIIPAKTAEVPVETSPKTQTPTTSFSSKQIIIEGIAYSIDQIKSLVQGCQPPLENPIG